MHNSLALREASRPGTGPRRVAKTPRRFLEFVVDGADLRGELAARLGPDSLIGDLVSVLVLDWPTGFPRQDFETLAGIAPSSLRSGRVPLYICPECGDLDCGAVTVALDVADEQVTWSDFAYENGYEQFAGEDVMPELGPFVFTRAAYESALDPFLKRPWPPHHTTPSHN